MFVENSKMDSRWTLQRVSYPETNIFVSRDGYPSIMIHKDEERNTMKKACDIKERIPNFKDLMLIFSREQVQVKSYITLKTTFGEHEYAK